MEDTLRVQCPGGRVKNRSWVMVRGPADQTRDKEIMGTEEGWSMD